MNGLKKCECAIFKSLLFSRSMFQVRNTYTNIKEHLQYLVNFTYYLTCSKRGPCLVLFIHSTELCTWWTFKYVLDKSFHINILSLFYLLQKFFIYLLSVCDSATKKKNFNAKQIKNLIFLSQYYSYLKNTKLQLICYRYFHCLH